MKSQLFKILVLSLYCLILVGFADCGRERVLVSYQIQKCPNKIFLWPQQKTLGHTVMYQAGKKFKNNLCSNLQNYVVEEQEESGRMVSRLEVNLTLKRNQDNCTLLSLVHFHGQGITSDSSRLKKVAKKFARKIPEILFKDSLYAQEKYPITDTQVFDNEELALKWCNSLSNQEGRY